MSVCFSIANFAFLFSIQSWKPFAYCASPIVFSLTFAVFNFSLYFDMEAVKRAGL